MKILNCTIHDITESQKLDGAIEGSQEFKEAIKKELLVIGMPTKSLLETKAVGFGKLVSDEIEKTNADEVMIGSGMPSHQPLITAMLEVLRIKYCYSFSKRECVEEHQADGSVKKMFTFVHEGFYRV